MEMLNTLVERLINVFRPRLHPIARVIKDMTAAAVLMSAICALAVGIIIFWPYLIG
jgi:diacylglycerol kinase